ncbi:MAG TPA: hypothetical protein VFN30_05890 [Chitinophagaceae bacterium]|nr:hypothetical protein [Chitinophagaceae bacterium]
MKRKIFISIAAVLLLSATGFSQQYNQDYLDSLIQNKVQPLISRNSKFVLTGYTTVGAKFAKDDTKFNGFSLNPILLWKPSEKIFVEAELETELEGNETVINLEYANVSFFLNKYITFRAGKFLSPYGIFQDRLHPAWINKLPTAPPGYGHDGVGPSAELGFDVRGGIPLGSAKLNYSIYVSNGPVLNTGEDEPGEEGMLSYENADDNNNNKTFGGRIGFLPFSNSSLEIGGSWQLAKPGDKESVYENLKTQQYALDLTYVKQLDFIKGLFDVKAQWNWVNVDKADYKDPDDPTGVATYTFDNKRNSVFAQAAYRPSMSPNKFLKKTELVFRYAGLTPPSGSKEPDKIKQYTYGLNYWVNWRTAVKLAYQRQENDNAFLVQFAVGF